MLEHDQKDTVAMLSDRTPYASLCSCCTPKMACGGTTPKNFPLASPAVMFVPCSLIVASPLRQGA